MQRADQPAGPRAVPGAAELRQSESRNAADDGKQALSETMRGGWDWLVESSDDEEGEQQLRRALATVEAEARVRRHRCVHSTRAGELLIV